MGANILSPSLISQLAGIQTEKNITTMKLQQQYVSMTQYAEWARANESKMMYNVGGHSILFIKSATYKTFNLHIIPR